MITWCILTKSNCLDREGATRSQKMAKLCRYHCYYQLQKLARGLGTNSFRSCFQLFSIVFNWGHLAPSVLGIFNILCMYLHAIRSYKKRSYKKRLVDLSSFKKRWLVEFWTVRNAFLRIICKNFALRNDHRTIQNQRHCNNFTSDKSKHF